MERFILSFLLLLSLTIDHASAGIRPLGRFFKLVPIEKAHVTQGSAHDRELDPTSIKIFVWNIKKAMLSQWASEFSSYGKNRDVFLIQEAYQTPHFVETLNQFASTRWDLGISFLYRRYNDQATGNMVGSRVEPSYVRVEHTLDYEPATVTPKTTTFAKYPISGSQKDLLVISIHGINITNFSSFTRHMGQVEKEIESHDGPVVFAGDFNTRTAGRMNYLVSMMKRLKFTAVDFKNGEYRMKFKFTPHYLDHGFIRGLSLKSAEVLKDSVGSDHKPMTMELALTN